MKNSYDKPTMYAIYIIIAIALIIVIAYANLIIHNIQYDYTVSYKGKRIAFSGNNREKQIYLYSMNIWSWNDFSTITTSKNEPNVLLSKIKINYMGKQYVLTEMSREQMESIGFNIIEEKPNLFKYTWSKELQDPNQYILTGYIVNNKIVSVYFKKYDLSSSTQYPVLLSTDSNKIIKFPILLDDLEKELGDAEIITKHIRW
jgi:hypothetical protein